VNWFSAMISPILMALVVVSRPVREWVVACLVVSGVFFVVGLGVAGTGPLEISRMVSAMDGFWTVQILVVGFGPALGQTARTAALAAETHVELAARQQAATVIRRDRERRLGELEQHTLPLLRDIAAGLLEPGEPAVRRACASRASVLRRMLAASDGSASRLGELEAPIEAAEARGIRVDVQLAGDLRRLPPDVRDALAGRVGEALAPVAGGKVLVTVLCSPEEAQVYLSYPVSPVSGWLVGPRRRDHGEAAPPQTPVSRWIQESTDVDGGVAWLELRWSA
jgi:hypothetical protein